MTHNSKYYLPNLDALRFVAFLSVFLFHSFYTENDSIKTLDSYIFIKYDVFGSGNLGVNFFFVISGFLITYLLFVRSKSEKRVDLLNFYRNRILRIWPLFFIAVIIGFFGFPVLKELLGETSYESATLWKYSLFINNFEFIDKGPPDASILGVLWSVAVEEQFYLFWPFLFFIKPKILPYIFTLVVLLSVLFRSYYDDIRIHEYHTLACIGDMAVGAVFAYFILYSKGFREWLVNLSKTYCILIWVSIIVLAYSKDWIYGGGFGAYFRVLFAISSIFVVLEQVFCQNSWFKLGNVRWCTYLGRRSYGLYIYHFLGILIAVRLNDVLGINNSLFGIVVWDTLLALIVTVIISVISYRFIEAPLLKLKS